jgi:hypothetical protein
VSIGVPQCCSIIFTLVPMIRASSNVVIPAASAFEANVEGVPGRHARISATQFLLQIGVSEVSMMRREASRVSFLMCPFCVRSPSSESATYRTAAAEPLRRSGVAVGQPDRQG